MIKTKLAIGLTAIVLATGCATKAQTGALIGGVVGAAALGPVGGSAAAHWAMGGLGAVLGGIFGSEVGKQLDDADKAKIATSVNNNTTEKWTSSDGTQMKAETKEIAPAPTGEPRKDVTITVDEKKETNVILIQKQDKWIRE